MSAPARMIEAAVATICEEGYYRASSNRIARRAGVTWGVIQYHFGTREGLLLAVVKQSADELVERLESARITGDTVAERLDALADVVWSHYRQPAFLASLQVVLNLTHDPRTGAETVATLADLEQRMAGLWQGLMDQVVDRSRQRPDLGAALFDILRGVAIGESILDAFPRGTTRPRRSDRETLVRALTLLVEDGT